MDLKYSPEDEAFRQELRSWLEKNLPSGWGTPEHKEPEDEEAMRAFNRDWYGKLYEGGWAGFNWPKEYGGRGATIMQQLIFGEEMARMKAPPGAAGIGPNMVGPTLIAHGTEEQKKRFLSKILSGEEVWCQGFSEPDSGSDLASLSTRAEEDGDDFVINGSKVWTSGAHNAQWCIMLVRTDPNAPKHRGISFLLMDMKTPGVSIKPLVQITGEAEFNQTFLDDVRIPKKNLVGEKNKGWYVAMTTLTHERSGIATTTRFRLILDDLIKMAKETVIDGIPASKDPVIRQKLAQLHIDIEAMRYNGYRTVTAQLRGEPPGPETSMSKLIWSEMAQRLYDVAMQIQGPHAQLLKGSKETVDTGKWQFRFLRSRANTIEQGTSEIQRNIISERVLSLPR